MKKGGRTIKEKINVILDKNYIKNTLINLGKKYGVKDFYRITFSPISEIIKEYKN